MHSQVLFDLLLTLLQRSLKDNGFNYSEKATLNRIYYGDDKLKEIGSLTLTETTHLQLCDLVKIDNLPITSNVVQELTLDLQNHTNKLNIQTVLTLLSQLIANKDIRHDIADEITMSPLAIA